MTAGSLRTKIQCGCVTILCMVVFMLCYIWKHEDSMGFPQPMGRIKGKESIDSKGIFTAWMHSKDSTNMKEAVTVVSAYFNLGSFRKGRIKNRTENEYQTWIKVFSKIKNPVIVYFDTHQDLDMFNQIRKNFTNTTQSVLVSQDELWAFRLQPNISAIYADPKYPKYHPNTVKSDYSCTMNAKYELMLGSVRENPFNTNYFCWLDIGLYRYYSLKSDDIEIRTPLQFDVTKVAYTEVYKFKRLPNWKKIFLENSVWVCGCFFIAEHGVMEKWVLEYMAAVEYYLKQGYSNTDQQVLYAMVQEGRNKTQIQTYMPDGRYRPWFHLGYLAKEKPVTQTLNNSV